MRRQTSVGASPGSKAWKRHCFAVCVGYRMSSWTKLFATSGFRGLIQTLAPTARLRQVFMIPPQRMRASQ